MMVKCLEIIKVRFSSGPIPGLQRSPGEGNGNAFQYSCTGKSHGQRGLAGYSPRDCKELGTTEHSAQAARMQHF